MLKHSIQRTTFKGRNALFAVKEYSHKKLQRQKGSCVEIGRSSPLNQAEKRPRFTGIKKICGYGENMFKERESSSRREGTVLTWR